MKSRGSNGWIRKGASGYCRLLVAALGLASAGCVPFVTQSYYRPQSMEGRIAGASCPPTNSVWLFERDSVVVGARAETHGQGMSIDMYVEVPEGKTAKLLSDSLEVLSPDGTASKGRLFGRVMVSHGRSRRLEHGELLTGASRSLFGAGYSPYTGRIRGQLYWFAAYLALPHSETFVVRLPPFLVSGVEQSVPEIVFTADSEFQWIVSLNC